jgi:hypothetical protein
MSYDNYPQTYRRTGMEEPAKLQARANFWTPTADQGFMLGMRFSTDDGREFRYSKNGATEIAKNLLVQSEAIDAQQLDNLQNVTSPGATAGDKVFSIDIVTGSGITDGELVDGYLIVNQGTSATDEGDMYIIKNNTYTTSDTVMQIEIADQGGLRNTIAATSNISVVKNKYRDVIVKPTALTAPVVGATTTIVSANYYFWAQTKGVASILVDAGDTIVVGEPAGQPGTAGTAGAIGLVANDLTDPVYGTVITAAAGADYALIDLDI